MAPLRSTTIRVDHLCCGMESKLIRDLLTPLDAVVDVKISLTDRRINVEHSASLASQAIVEMLNNKHLGASIQDHSVVEAVGSSFNHAETVRLTVNALQMGIFAATLAFAWLGCGLLRGALPSAVSNVGSKAFQRRQDGQTLLLKHVMLDAWHTALR